MIVDPERRQPTSDDVTLLANALRENGVEYVVIGGAAMALHGFPRMTRDIDLFLPVDPENNARLLKALQAVPNSKAGLARLNPEYMDQGYSTAFEGEIAIDLLYVAADKTFADLRPHVQRVIQDGVPVWTLDVDGMLISKKTTRQSDVPDRLKLERLSNALAVIRAGAGAAPDGKALEEQVLETGSKNPTVYVRDLAEGPSQHSPGAVYPSKQAAIRERAVALAERGDESRPLPPGPA